MVAGIAKVREKHQKNEETEAVETTMDTEAVEDRSQLDDLIDAAMKDAKEQE